jgi:hypothetical protein
MPENRLARFGLTETGEKVTYLHKACANEADKLGKALVTAYDSPAVLMERNAQLEREMGQMVQEEAEREQKREADDGKSTERAALKALEAAQAEIENKDGEMRSMRIALEAARDELHKLQQQKTELRRELEGERSELHKLRQEKRTTQLPPHMLHDLPRHGSPRQLEHPELVSPRQAQRRAASASANRPSASAVGVRPFSARPAASSSSAAAVAAAPSSARSYDSDPPLARGPAAAFVSPREPSAPAAPRPGGSARGRAGGAAAAAASPSAAVERAMARYHDPPPPRLAHNQRNSGTQTEQDLSDQAWERQVKELQRANARLQTALLAAALDPDGGAELSGLLAAVDRGLAKRSGLGSSPRKPSGPPPDKPWPFTRSSLPTGTKLPKGFTQWPPMT